QTCSTPNDAMGRSREGEESVKAFEETDVVASIAAPTTAARAPLDTDRESKFLPPRRSPHMPASRANETRVSLNMATQSRQDADMVRAEGGVAAARLRWPMNAVAR